MVPDIVPPDLLAPPDARSRSFRHDDAALVLDGYLRRLAAQEARCRVVLGRLGRVFLERRGQHLLGFARLGDYARERLGLSARELQSLASVTERMEQLPAIRMAFERGEVSWAQVRLLVTVVVPETEEGWLALAGGRTVRALEAAIRELGRSETAEEDDGGPHVRFRLRCPRRFLRLWREVVDLARRMAGAELSHGQAAEAIAAEGLSARSAGCEVWPDTARQPELPGDVEETFIQLERAPVAEVIPEEVEVLGLGVEELDAFALDGRMRAVVQASQRIDWQMGRLLRVFLDRRLFRVMGFPSAARYLRERLGLSERKARALVALERRTWEAPGLGEAYRAGTLSWVRALTLLPVIGEKTASAWIARAEEVTVRRLADEVEWALVAREPFDPIAPPPPGAALDMPDRQTCARPDWEWPDAEIVFSAPAEVVALLRTAILAFTRPADPLCKGLEQLLEHVKVEWEGQPRHRDPIFARDGWRCAVPACSSRRNLHDHHLIFRSRGGENAQDNRVTVCAWHHLRGIHAGRVRAWGAAPDAITWELGVRAGREPLLRLTGDWYVGGTSGSPMPAV